MEFKTSLLQRSGLKLGINIIDTTNHQRIINSLQAQCLYDWYIIHDEQKELLDRYNRPTMYSIITIKEKQPIKPQPKHTCWRCGQELNTSECSNGCDDMDYNY